MAGALAAVVALAPVVGEAAESDGEGVTVGVGLDVGDGESDGDGDGDPTGGLPVAVGCGVGLGLQLGDDCEDGVGEPDCAGEVPPPDDEGDGTVVEGPAPSGCPLLPCPPLLPWL